LTVVPNTSTNIPMMSTNINELVGESLFGKVRRNILSILFLHNRRSFYLLELIRLIASGRGAVQRELSRLTKAGLVLRTRKGNQVHYRANEKSLVFDELRAIFAKTTGLNDVVTGALSPLEDQIGLAFIHGAFAMGRAQRESEIELIVISEVPSRNIAAALESVRQETGRVVRLTLLTPDELKKKYAAADPVARRIAEESKIFLIGGRQELECILHQEEDLFSGAGIWG
jgi:DNA-binding transcriptional ArsR family regulator